MKLFKFFKNKKLQDKLDRADRTMTRMSFESMKKSHEIEALRSQLKANGNEKELIYLYNRVDRLRNELSRKKAEIKRVTGENRRIKESNAQLIGEKMQLRKELNRYKARGWDYDVT